MRRLAIPVLVLGLGAMLVPPEACALSCPPENSCGMEMTAPQIEPGPCHGASAASWSCCGEASPLEAPAALPSSGPAPTTTAPAVATSLAAVVLPDGVAAPRRAASPPPDVGLHALLGVFLL